MHREALEIAPRGVQRDECAQAVDAVRCFVFQHGHKYLRARPAQACRFQGSPDARLAFPVGDPDAIVQAGPRQAPAVRRPGEISDAPERAPLGGGRVHEEERVGVLIQGRDLAAIRRPESLARVAAAVLEHAPEPAAIGLGDVHPALVAREDDSLAVRRPARLAVVVRASRDLAPVLAAGVDAEDVEARPEHDVALAQSGSRAGSSGGQQQEGQGEAAVHVVSPGIAPSVLDEASPGFGSGSVRGRCKYLKG